MMSLHDVLYGRRGFRIREEHQASLEAVREMAREVEKSRADSSFPAPRNSESAIKGKTITDTRPAATRAV
jgi:hypothetical protein